MSLADELLADLEEGGELAEEENASEDDHLDTIPEVDEVEMQVDNTDQSVRSIAKLRDSSQVIMPKLVCKCKLINYDIMCYKTSRYILKPPHATKNALKIKLMIMLGLIHELIITGMHMADDVTVLHILT